MKSRTILSLPFLCLCHFSFVLTAVAYPAVARDISWATKSPMPIPRVDFGVAVAGKKIYVVGGYSGTTLSLVHEYNPRTNSWTEKAPMPSPRARLVVASVNGKVYAIGGVELMGAGRVRYSYATEEYDPVADTWRTRADFPLPPPFNDVFGNAYIGGAASGGKIYVTVFNTEIPGLGALYEYDPLSDVWVIDKSPVPLHYTQFSVASLNGRLYVVAAGDNGSFTDGASFAEYDVARDVWVIQSSTASARRFMSLVASEQEIYAVGGLEVAFTEPEETFYSEVSTVEVFDTATGTWTGSTPIPTARHSPGLAAIDGKLFVMGGALLSSNSSLAIPLAVVEEGSIQASGGNCSSTPVRLCLNNGRFQLEVEWRDAQDNHGVARVVPHMSADSGLFYFFGPNNWEMLVKVLDGCSVNDHYWVFFAATTSVEFTLTVTDTETHEVMRYSNPLGQPANAVTDTTAFATCP